MAIFYLRVRTFGRSQGKSGSRATSAAAYRSGERIRDERTGRVYDHRRRVDVIHKEIVLPAQHAAQPASLAWARNRAKLWNAAEHAELRRDSRVAREFIVALPHELAPSARTHLATRFAQEIADRYGSAVDLAIHAPRGDARNFHAHLLATTREVTPDGLGRKTTLELSGTRRHELGLPRWREEIESLRKHWAHLTNGALERAQVASRITYLSPAERGLAASDAPMRLPLAAYHMEQRGARSFIAEKIRARRRADLERAHVERGGRAPEPESKRRTPGYPSSERTFAAIGRSMLREIGAGMRAAWRGLQARLGPPLSAGSEPSAVLEVSLSRGQTGRSTAAAMERSSELSHRIPTVTAVRAETIGPRPQIDEVALKSAHNWLAYREKQRVREASLEDSESNAAHDGRLGQHRPGQELEPGPEREHSRGHGDDFGL